MNEVFDRIGEYNEVIDESAVQTTNGGTSNNSDTTESIQKV